MSLYEPVLSHPFLRALSIGGLLFASTTARAGGFQFNEQSASASGKANSVVATIKDPTAIFHNPAGLTKTKGTQFIAGVSTVFAFGEYKGAGLPGNGGPTDGQRISYAPSFVPHVYASHELTDRIYLGLGFYLPYGSSVEWEDPDEFVGRTQSRSIALRTYYFTPTIAFKLSENLSAAVGVSLVPASLYIERNIGDPVTQAPLLSEGGLVELGATAFGVGASAGVQWNPIEHLHLGLSYRSSVHLGFEGEVNFSLPATAPASLRAAFPDQTGHGDLSIPHVFAVGAGWEQGPFGIEIGAQLTLWESFQDLTINFDAGLPAPQSSSPRNWENAMLVRIGGSYVIERATLRAGVGYDFAPAPDETLDFAIPPNSRLLVSLGLGYDFGMFQLDLSYLAAYAFAREFGPGVSVNIPTGGTFGNGLSNVISLSAGVRL